MKECSCNILETTRHLETECVFRTRWYHYWLGKPISQYFCYLVFILSDKVYLDAFVLRVSFLKGKTKAVILWAVKVVVVSMIFDFDLRKLICESLTSFSEVLGFSSQLVTKLWLQEGEETSNCCSYISGINWKSISSFLLFFYI